MQGSVEEYERYDTARMLTYQDMVEAGGTEGFIAAAIDRHTSSTAYRTACDADLYDRQMNKTINEYTQFLYTATGSRVVDFTANNARIASNFFHRLNTQRVMYSLGHGVTFADDEGGVADEGGIKEGLGPHFDHDLQTAAYYALIHGVSFGFWNMDRLHVFPLTEFVPLWDETDGTLRAGIRFWRLDPTRQTQIVLYEEDGYTRLAADDSLPRVVVPKRPYIERVAYVPADGVDEVVDGMNYGSLPIVPLWGSKRRQSTLVGMRQAIDSYDLIRSGFANDVTDCSQIYWLLSNAGGMTDADLQRFRDRLKLQHVAVVDGDAGQDVQAYTQEPPYAARKQYLDDIRAQIYEDFGAMDVHTVAAGETNDHIDAAYQPMDEEATDFEYQVSEFLQQVLALRGQSAQPVFHRSRISNQSEQVAMVVQEAQWLDQETILRKLPNIEPSEIPVIMQRVEEESSDNMDAALAEGVTVEAVGVEQVEPPDEEGGR